MWRFRAVEIGYYRRRPRRRPGAAVLEAVVGEDGSQTVNELFLWLSLSLLLRRGVSTRETVVQSWRNRNLG